MNTFSTVAVTALLAAGAAAGAAAQTQTQTSPDPSAASSPHQRQSTNTGANEAAATSDAAGPGSASSPHQHEAMKNSTKAETDSAVLVAAHGNSIRALRKHLEGISDADIVGLEVPTGIPFRMLLDYDLTVQSSGYLGDPAAAAAAAAAVSRQAG